MTREIAENMINEMITNLGFENKTVILACKAYDEERWIAISLLYGGYKKIKNPLLTH